MARNWEGLSEPYRHRLEARGIDRNDYESGVSLSAARGHGQTRESLVNEIQSYKIALHGDRPRFKERGSLRAIDRNDDGQKRSVSDLKQIAAAYRHGMRQNDIDSIYYQLREDDFSDADKYH